MAGSFGYVRRGSDGTYQYGLLTVIYEVVDIVFYKSPCIRDFTVFREGVAMPLIKQGSKPVSYTHLDVYKRQGIYSEKDLGPLANYIDYERYGRDIAMDEQGRFTDEGYVRVASERWAVFSVSPSVSFSLLLFLCKTAYW